MCTRGYCCGVRRIAPKTASTHRRNSDPRPGTRFPYRSNASAISAPASGRTIRRRFTVCSGSVPVPTPRAIPRLDSDDTQPAGDQSPPSARRSTRLPQVLRLSSPICPLQARYAPRHSGSIRLPWKIGSLDFDPTLLIALFQRLVDVGSHVRNVLPSEAWVVYPVASVELVSDPNACTNRS